MTLETDELGPEWNNLQSPAKGGGNKTNEVSLFMKLTPRKEPYKIRLACTPITFRKHSWAFRTLKQWPISPASEQALKDLDIAWKEGNFMPQQRHAAFVFDREFNSRLRILEAGKDVFGPIYNTAKTSNVNPASPTKGWDWIIIVSEELVNGKKVTLYNVSLDISKNGPTPLTEEEKEILENPKFQRTELVNRYFVKSTPEEIKDLWEQLPPELRVNKSRDLAKKDGSKYTGKSAVGSTTKSATSATMASIDSVDKSDVVKEVQHAVEPSAELKDDDFLAEPDSEPDMTDVNGDDEPARMF